MFLQSEDLQSWSLTGLQNVFSFALEQKSKYLIQACIFIVEKDFSGVSSFSHQMQVKFLLESIRHIIADNCQEEFIHIMQYLKLLHKLCSDIGCEEEYVNSVLRIKQSFVLYTLLDNESASNVCHVMNDFFPKDDPLKSFDIEIRSMKRRFLAVVKRQIYGFKKLVVKLLTDMEFRSYYFYDEWMEEYGSTFHNEMVKDINTYLMKIEGCLLSDINKKEFYEKWFETESIRNPSMLYFLKLLMESTDSKVSEFDVLRLLKWMFPGLDTSLLTMPCTGSLEVPKIFKKSTFLKVFIAAGWTIQKKKPWDYDNFKECIECFMSERRIISKENKKCNKEKDLGRVPLGALDLNQLHNHSLRLRKRKRTEIETTENQSVKRRCTVKTPIKSTLKKSLFIDLSKKNVFAKTPKGSVKLKSLDDANFVINMSMDSPQCKQLLESGSKFFSLGGKRKKLQPVVFIDVRTPISNEVSSEAIEFSDKEVESDDLKVSNDTMGLTWIAVVRNTKSTPVSHGKKTCRSLIFKSESSDDHVSESEPESSQTLKSMSENVLKLLDQSIVPDLYSIHVERVPETLPCYVKLESLTQMIIGNERDCLIIENCRVFNKTDIEIIKNDVTEFRFRNYSCD